MSQQEGCSLLLSVRPGGKGDKSCPWEVALGREGSSLSSPQSCCMHIPVQLGSLSAGKGCPCPCASGWSIEACPRRGAHGLWGMQTVPMIFPAVLMIILPVLPLEWALLLEINGLLLLPAQCTGLVAGEAEDCVLHWHFGAFSFWFEVGAVSPAGSGTMLHPPVGPGPCSRAALWQEPRGEEHVKTTRFQRRKSRKREYSCPLPS